MTNSQLSISKALDFQGEEGKHNECHEPDELIGPALEKCCAPYGSNHLPMEVLESFWMWCVACARADRYPERLDMLRRLLDELRNPKAAADYLWFCYQMFLKEILSWMLSETTRLLLRPTDDPQRLAKALDQFERFTDLIERGDLATAADCIREHFRTASAGGDRPAEANSTEDRAMNAKNEQSTLLVGNIEDEPDRAVS